MDLIVPESQVISQFTLMAQYWVKADFRSDPVPFPQKVSGPASPDRVELSGPVSPTESRVRTWCPDLGESVRTGFATAGSPARDQTRRGVCLLTKRVSGPDVSL